MIAALTARPAGGEGPQRRWLPLSAPAQWHGNGTHGRAARTAADVARSCEGEPVLTAGVKLGSRDSLREPRTEPTGSKCSVMRPAPRGQTREGRPGGAKGSGTEAVRRRGSAAPPGRCDAIVGDTSSHRSPPRFRGSPPGGERMAQSGDSENTHVTVDAFSHRCRRAPHARRRSSQRGRPAPGPDHARATSPAGSTRPTAPRQPVPVGEHPQQRRPSVNHQAGSRALLRCGIRGDNGHAGPASDRSGEFSERRGDPLCGQGVDSELVVSAAQILQEGMPGNHYLCCPIRL